MSITANVLGSPKARLKTMPINQYRKGDMQDSLGVEVSNHQIREEKVDFPYKRFSKNIAIMLFLQGGVTLTSAYCLGQSNSDQLFNTGTVVALIVFLCGALMMGQFPTGGEAVIDSMHEDRRPHSMRELSLSSQVRGALFMISGALYVMACFGMGWVDRIR
jgi:hypothetical protein